MKIYSRLTAMMTMAVFSACGGGTTTRPDDKPGQEQAAVKQKPVKQGPKVSEEAKQEFLAAVRSYRHQKKSGVFNYDSLLGQFRAVLDEDPKFAEAHYNIGCVLEAMRKDKEAADHYKKALAIRPDLSPAAANWGALLERKGKLDQALLVYKRALSEDAKNSAVLLNMAGIYQRQRKFDLALKTASGVLIRDPGNVGAYRLMASLFHDKGDLNMAHLICLRGLTVKEKDPRLLNTLGLVLLRLKKVPEALVQFRQVLKQSPDMVPTRFNVAKIALDYKDFRVAREEFGKILQYEPDNRKAAIGLGIALRGIGNYQAARAHFTALTEKHSKDPLPHYWLGVLALRNFNDMKAGKESLQNFLKVGGSKVPSGHPAYAMLTEIKQNAEMEKKMKVMEKQAEAEAKRQAEIEKKLAERRVKMLDDAWARAKKEGLVLPPAKLDAKNLPFVLIPPAVTPDKKTKVQLVGMIFRDIKTVEIGTLKAKWRQKNKTTLEIIVPKGLGLGAWDVMVTYKDKNEDPLLFVGGLWVGKQPKKPKPPKAKPAPKTEKSLDGKEKGKSEPKDNKVVKGKKTTTAKGLGQKPKPKGPKEDKEPEEPAEPAEP